jgi:hypothetical protein
MEKLGVGVGLGRGKLKGGEYFGEDAKFGFFAQLKFDELGLSEHIDCNSLIFAFDHQDILPQTCPHRLFHHFFYFPHH